MIDTDNSGTITFDELKEGLKRVGSELMESEIKDLMDAVRSKVFFYLCMLTCIIVCRVQTNGVIMFGRQTLTTVEQ